MKYQFIPIWGISFLLIACQPFIFAVKSSKRIANENRARNHEDLTADWKYPNGPYRLDFKVGDRFKLKEPMYLHCNVANVVNLSETTMSFVPKIERYKNNPEAYVFGGDNPYQIIRLVPKDESIELVAIKRSIQAGFILYFVFDGQNDWFRISTFRKWDSVRGGHLSDGRRIHPYTYKKELFSKLPR